MKNVSNIGCIWLIVMTLGMGNNEQEIKIPTAEESEKALQKLNTQNDKEAQEAKKVAKYFTTLIEAREELGVKGIPTREQEMVIMDALFPMIKEKELKKEKREAFSSKCFMNAKTLKDANKCVDKANKILGFISDDFTEWNTQIKQKAVEQIEHYFPCVENSVNVEELNECYKHLYK